MKVVLFSDNENVKARFLPLGNSRTVAFSILPCSDLRKRLKEEPNDTLAYVDLSGYAKAWAAWWSGEDWQWVQEAHIELYVDGSQVADLMSSNNTNRDTWQLWTYAGQHTINTDIEVRLHSVKNNNEGGTGGLGAIYYDSRYDDISLDVTPVPEPGILALVGIGLAGFLRRRR